MVVIAVVDRKLLQPIAMNVSAIRKLIVKLQWIIDGFCDNKANNEGCQYDGGDCCGSNFNALHIIYGTKCQCLLGDSPLVPAATVSNS